MKKLTSMWISQEDYDFCKERGLKFTEVFRMGMRNWKEDAFVPSKETLEEQRKKIERISGHLESLWLFIQEKGGEKMVEEALDCITT